MRFPRTTLFGLLTLLCAYVCYTFPLLTPMLVIGGLPCFVLFLIYLRHELHR